MAKLDKEGLIPLYVQLTEAIKKKIYTGELETGDNLPTEEELENDYSVSKTTVRQALQLLLKQGFINKDRGKTAYVTEKKLEHPVGFVSSFTEDMIKKGLKPSTKLINISFLKPHKIAAKKLKLEKERKVIFIKRVRFVENEPISINCVYLHPRIPIEIFKNGLPQESLYKTLEEECHVNFSSADESVEAVLASKLDAKLLSINEGEPLLLVTRLTYDENNNPIEWNETWFRGDKFKYHAKLKGKEGEGNTKTENRQIVKKIRKRRKANEDNS